jgi:hypoxia up-regulated 1
MKASLVNVSRLAGATITVLVSMMILGVTYGNVIGIDFGSDTMKVAIVQPGSPLEVVTNFQSKRKTPTAVTFYRNERMFGSDATVLMSRKPELTFTKFNRLLGKSIDHPQVSSI